MDEAISPYPLAWPPGWERTPVAQRVRATAAGKDASPSAAVGRILAELAELGVRAWQVIVSSNLALIDERLPEPPFAEPADPGIAIYWRETEPGTWPYRCIALDKYDRLTDNLLAAAELLAAIRATARYAPHLPKRLLQGLASMPPVVNRHTTWWADILHIPVSASATDIKHAYQRQRSRSHPDHGGNADTFRRVMEAYEAALSTRRR